MGVEGGNGSLNDKMQENNAGQHGGEGTVGRGEGTGKNGEGTG